MFGKPKMPSVQVCRDIDTTPYFWCSEAVLLEVKNGKGALRWISQEYDMDYYALSALMLNDKPILQASLPGCPTCEGLLATGYGIENTGCTELREIADKVNAPFEGIHQATSVISPILGLLQDGMYVLADCDVFPTDGNGHFFWDVANKMTMNPATACCLTHIEDEFYCMWGIPAYIYPSQGTDKFDAARIKYYQGLLSDRQHFPRAIAYHCHEFCSILLDGHHKAAACALNGETVPTLMIIPCAGITYKPGVQKKKMNENSVKFCEVEIPASFFSGKQMHAIRNTINQCRRRGNVRLTENTLISRSWEPEYARAVFRFPNVKDLAVEFALRITQIHDSDTEKWLENAVGINARKLESAIRHYFRQDEQRAMALALRCAKLNSDPQLMRTAFLLLTLFKDNPDIEQLFVDWLVNDNDPHSELHKIADNHWNE